jgi:hypothetical protein
MCMCATHPIAGVGAPPTDQRTGGSTPGQPAIMTREVGPADQTGGPPPAHQEGCAARTTASSPATGSANKTKDMSGGTADRADETCSTEDPGQDMCRIVDLPPEIQPGGRGSPSLTHCSPARQTYKVELGLLSQKASKATHRLQAFRH